MHEHKKPKNQVQWKLSSNAGAIREDEVAVLVVVAAMAMVTADEDNVAPWMLLSLPKLNLIL